MIYALFQTKLMLRPQVIGVVDTGLYLLFQATSILFYTEAYS